MAVSVERKGPGREAGFELAGLSDFSGHWGMEWNGICGLEVQTGRGLGEGGGLSLQEKSVWACMEAMMAEGQWLSLSTDQPREEQPS